jgi:hypothetical protein
MASESGQTIDLRAGDSDADSALDPFETYRIIPEAGRLRRALDVHFKSHLRGASGRLQNNACIKDTDKDNYLVNDEDEGEVFWDAPERDQAN